MLISLKCEVAWISIEICTQNRVVGYCNSCSHLSNKLDTGNEIISIASTEGKKALGSAGVYKICDGQSN